MSPAGGDAEPGLRAERAPGLGAARAAKARLVAALAGHPAVNGVGLVSRAGSYAVKVNLAEAKPADLELPAHVGGVEILVEVVGPIVRR